MPIHIDDFFTIYEHDGKVIVINEDITHDFDSSRAEAFDLNSINIVIFKDMILGGTPTFVRKLATIIRDVVINKLNLIVALSTAAVAARALQNDIILVMSP